MAGSGRRVVDSKTQVPVCSVLLQMGSQGVRAAVITGSRRERRRLQAKILRRKNGSRKVQIADGNAIEVHIGFTPNLEPCLGIDEPHSEVIIDTGYAFVLRRRHEHLLQQSWQSRSLRMVGSAFQRDSNLDRLDPTKSLFGQIVGIIGRSLPLAPSFPPLAEVVKILRALGVSRWV
jgi:hypothetical protein